jgi:hypothetical protein
MDSLEFGDLGGSLAEAIAAGKRSLSGKVAAAVAVTLVLGLLGAFLNARSGIGQALAMAVYALFVCGIGATYCFAWRLGQLLWNVRCRVPQRCHLRLEHHSNKGMDPGTWVRLVELGTTARFGRTTFSWTPLQILAQGEGFVFAGRYGLLLTASRRPLVSTLRT